MADDKEQAAMETEDSGEPKPNRKVKDSVFVDLFGRDETAPQNFLSLYNALHGTHLKLEDTKLEREMLDSVMYMAYTNDVAMRVDERIVVLIEHQSTLNQNMPFRMLEYVSRIYARIIEGRAKFKRALVQIPKPEFYVLYNGTEKLGAKSTQRLSDAFMRKKGDTADPHLELVVDVYNINVGIGDALLEKCSVLKQYAEFINLVRQAKKDGRDDAFTWAVKEAVRQGLLPNYLERKASEVINMLDMEYDYATDIAVQREEAREEGKTEGETKGMAKSLKAIMENLKLPLSRALDTLNITGKEREKYAAMLQMPL